MTLKKKYLMLVRLLKKQIKMLTEIEGKLRNISGLATTVSDKVFETNSFYVK